ncbi:MAG: hypothetical protein Q8M07_19050 [Prosthecobacter sp.]|nr:hypothetical protein [Prosthecobacter sp.]
MFINCPFDQEYLPVLRAIQFVLLACSYTPCSALQRDNAAHVRIEKIIDLMSSCRFAIHDISRTEADSKSSLPRFNMPYELGLFHGMARRGTRRDRQKRFLVLDRERYRYQVFLSDIAGQDIRSHDNHPEGAIRAVRNWLNVQGGDKSLPGAKALTRNYADFLKGLPSLLANTQLEEDELSFADWSRFVNIWIVNSAVPANQV